MLHSVLREDDENGFVDANTIDTPPTDRMATYYSIHAYDQESKHFAGEDRINDGKLYATFENACEVIEKKIQSHIEYFNSWEYEEEFKPPNREEMKQKMGKYVHYYETQAGWLWVISKWEVVVEEKPKQYVYQYFVEKETRDTVVAVRGSLLYSSLDDMLDILESEVVRFHLDMRARNWVPYSRQTIQEYMERNKRMIYDRVDDGTDEGTITYAIHKRDA